MNRLMTAFVLLFLFAAPATAKASKILVFPLPFVPMNDILEATLLHVKHKKLRAPDPVFFYRSMRVL